MFLKICVGGNRPVAHPLLVGLMKTDLKTAIMNSRVKAGHIDAAALGPDENRRFYVKLIL